MISCTCYRCRKFRSYCLPTLLDGVLLRNVYFLVAFMVYCDYFDDCSIYSNTEQCWNELLNLKFVKHCSLKRRDSKNISSKKFLDLKKKTDNFHVRSKLTQTFVSFRYMLLTPSTEPLSLISNYFIS